MSSDSDNSCSQNPYLGAQGLFLFLYGLTWAVHAASHRHYQILRVFYNPWNSHGWAFSFRFLLGLLILNFAPFVFLVWFGMIYGCLNFCEWWNFGSVFFAYLTNFAIPRSLRLCMGACFLQLYPPEGKWKEDREKLVKDLREHSPSRDLSVLAVYGFLFTAIALLCLNLAPCNGCYIEARWVIMSFCFVAAVGIGIVVASKKIPKSYPCGYMFDEIPESGIIIFCDEKIIYCDASTAKFFILKSGEWNEVASTDSVENCKFACCNSIISTRKSVILANMGEGWTYTSLLKYWLPKIAAENVLDMKFDHSGQIYYVKEGSNEIHVISVKNKVTDYKHTCIRPCGIALDPTESMIYVADASTNRIRRINLKTKSSATITFETSSKKQLFSNPKSVAICPQTGRLFVADTDHDRICVIDLKKPQMTELDTYHYQAKGITRNGFYGPQYLKAFYKPKQVVTGPDGELLVIDAQGIHLIKFQKNELQAVCIR